MQCLEAHATGLASRVHGRVAVVILELVGALEIYATGRTREMGCEVLPGKP